MKVLALALLTCIFSLPCAAKNIDWPALVPGQVLRLREIDTVPIAAVTIAKEYGFHSGGMLPSFEFFRTSDNKDFLVLDVSNGDEGIAYLFWRVEGEDKLRPVYLIHGDPKSGFFAVNNVGGISIGPGVDALTTYGWADFCETGRNSYSYKYDGDGVFKLVKVVHVDCAEKRRVLYSVKK